jgi:hypothetical protein
MRIEYADGSSVILDFVVATLDEARKAVADGAVNGVELFTEAGLSTAEAEAELKRIEKPPPS